MLPLAFLYNALYYACFIEETLSVAAAVKAGAEKVAGITRERYIHRLTWLRELSRFHISVNRDDRQKLSFVRISNVLENLRLDAADGTIRKQPYCVLLTGPPGCGKTGTAMKIAAATIRSIHGSFSPNDVVTLNETDDYQSEYRTNHKVVIFDDLGAENVNTKPINPWRKIIDFVNNIRKTALNPNLELKGNVYIEPELVIITTNLKAESNFNTYFYLSCPEAVMRRLTKVYYLNPDFQTCIEVRRETNGPSVNRAYAETCNFTKFNQPTITLDQMVDDVRGSFISQSAEQTRFVANINSVFDRLEPPTSAYHAFIEDVVKPNWFKKYPVSSQMEKGFTWYERLGRMFCFSEDYPLAEIQSGFENEEICLAHFHGETGRDFYLRTNFNSYAYYVLGDRLRSSFRYCPTMHGFLGKDENVILPEFSHLYMQSVYTRGLTFDFTLEELRAEAERRYDMYRERETEECSVCPSEEEDKQSSDSSPSQQHNLLPKNKLSKLEYSEENLIYPLSGFKCNPPQDDPFMSDLIKAKPKGLKLVLREWLSPLGAGDFVFYTKGKDDIPLFVVVEIKSQRNGIAFAQARKYGQEFLRELNLRYVGQKRVFAVGVTPTAYEIFHIFGADAVVKASFTETFDKWYQKFQRRCGASRESLDSNEL